MALLALALAGCAFNEHPALRDAGACGALGTECCEPDGGLRGPTPGVGATGCLPGLYCRARTCVACASGLQACDGRCVRTNDREHCGACGNACPTGFDCVGTATPRCERVCAPGQVRCGEGLAGECATLARDARHCGRCDNDCEARPPPNTASASCVSGSCAVGACADGFANCDMASANGCEVDTRRTVAHCGGCGRACPTPTRAVPACVDGACGFTCAEGYADCDGNPANGCEATLAADVANCGACANRCPAPPGTTATCVRGVCGTRSGVCPAGRGDCDGDPSNGCETALDSALAHCGACGRACARANASASCLAGTCVLGGCNAGFASCDGDPTNGCETALATSTASCGRCGAFCVYANARPVCAGGACALASCNAGFADCDGDASDGCEVDTRSNARHCGGCDRACAQGELCVDGACRLVCPTGQTACAGRCVDTRTDLANCGACGRACATGQVCANGACAVSCAGLTNCAGTCRDLATDVANCGACGRACAAGQRCNRGACELSCPSGQTACGGACATVASDPANCGACGTSCAGRFANSAASCVGGACVLGACAAGYGNCDGAATNGCETNLGTSAASCGACGRSCEYPNATATCAAGRCALGPCASGYASCDGIAENGCETNLNTAVGHCGRCGNACTTSVSGLVPICTAGVCRTALGTCSAGTGDCDGVPTNGCETNTATSLAHCGACGRSCALLNATETCQAGVCTLGTCSSSWGNCDGVTQNGCETSIRSNPAHCGGCGRPCAYANASATCVFGLCSLGACAQGYANCDGASSNGCEASLLTDPANCGGCRRRCASGEVCAGGACAPMCPSGQTNCAGGCVNTAADGANCGACGSACAAGQRCVGGACVTACGSGETACGSACVNPQTDPSNCGACGTVCTGGRLCAAGACVCAAGQTLCGSVCVDLQSNVANCGACGSACGMGQVCSAGACASTCATGTVSCAGSCVDTLTDPSHCGPLQPASCDRVCALANATSLCSGGTCGIAACFATHANCNGMTADGCEVDISRTATSCGGCGNNCNTLPGVASGACAGGLCASLVCVTGRGDCNGNGADGCEAALASDAANCGACGNACPKGQACVGGACA